jgi:molecular chaperone DnaK
MSDLIAGIDLGTTNSLIGVVDAGFPILLADRDGRRLTPSVVFFPESGDSAPVVGTAAARWAALRPARTVYSVKRLMGLRAGEVNALDLPFALTGAGDDRANAAAVRIRMAATGADAEARDYSPEEVSAFILRKLKADAEAALEQPVDRAVITVPAYFNDAQRQATVRAGELAGFRVERILNEPTAAALAYGLDRLGDRSHIAVYDLGGGTFDISILELDAGLFQVLATNGNTRLGGDDIDAAVAAHLARELAVSPRDPAFASLRELGRDAKERLSNERATAVYLPFEEGSALPRTCEISRAQLEAWAAPILERTRAHCLHALADAKLAPADLDAVILVGGATRMPLVRSLVAEIFGREPDTTQNPDEAIALGATIQAGILAGSVRDVILLDVTPLSLGIETFGGLANVIIARNTTIPTKAGEMFTNAVAGQRTVEIHVVQGERERARDNWTLGRFDLDFTPGPRGSARVGVQFEIDANGILHVLARDTKTGVEKRVEMRSAVDVEDERVEQMIAESVEHAFEDFDARLLIETQLKSREMLPGVQLGLQMVGDRLTAAECERILALAAEVEAALPLDDLARLKSANAALDAGTQELATLLMEQAMDEALANKGVV